MNRRILLILLAVYAVLPTQPVIAADSAANRPRAVLEGVPGLEKRVTYTETKIPLGEMIQKVADETGVPLTAAKEVADEPVAVVVKEFPARELLEQLAELLDYQWSRRRVGQAVSLPVGGNRQDNSLPHYEIWQDLASRQREEALRNAVNADVERRFQEEMSAYRELATKSQEEIRRLLEAEMPRQRQVEKLPLDERLALARSPEEKARQQRLQRLRDMWSPIARALALWMNRLPPEQWAALRAGWGITFSSTPQGGELPLPPDMLRTFRSAQPMLSGAVPEFGPPDPTRYEELRRAEQEMQERWRTADGYRVFVRFAKNYPDPAFIVFNALTTPLSGSKPIGPEKRVPNFVINIAPEDSRPADPPDPQRQTLLEQDPLLGAKKPFPPESVLRSEPVSLPSLRRYRTLQDLLPDLARIYGANFIADSYWTALRAYQLPQTPEAMALFTVLDRLTDPVSTWDRHDGRADPSGPGPALIRIRDRNWFLDRTSEIPLRTVRRWVALCEQCGALSLAEYASLVSSLSEAQLDSLFGLRAQPVFPPPLEDLNRVNDAREFLRLYALLLPDQRRVLESGRPLLLSQLPARTHPILRAMLNRFALRQQALNSREPWVGGRLLLTGEPQTRLREERGGGVTYRTEPARQPAAGTAPQQPSMVASRPSPAAASARSYPVKRLKLQIQYGPELLVSAELVVAVGASEMPHAARD